MFLKRLQVTVIIVVPWIDVIIVIKLMHLCFYKDSLKLEEECLSTATAEEREIKVRLHVNRSFSYDC